MNLLLKKTFLILLVFVVLVSLGSCKEKNTSKLNKVYSPITDFREIPGITPEEITAIETIIASKKSFSGTVMLGAESFYAGDGQLQGFATLTYAWLSSIFKIPFEPVVVEWDELLAGLESQQFDFSLDIPTRWGTNGKHYATGAIVERGMRLFVGPLTNSTHLQWASRPLRYGYLDMQGKEEQFFGYLDPNIILIAVPNLTVAKQMLSSGELDAFIGVETTETVITNHSSIETIPGMSYHTVSLSTCNPQLEPIISTTQKCLLAGGGYYLNKLHEEGHYQYLRARLHEKLTDEEKAYLVAHQAPGTAIPVGVPCDSYPTSFYNAQEQQWQGIAVDLLAEIEKVTGLQFVFPHAIDADWMTLKSMLDANTVFLTTELIRTPERRGGYLWPSRPYLTDHYALLSMSEYPNINVSQIALSRVGLLSGTAYAEAFNEMYPNHKNVVYYNSNPEAFEALERGDVDLLMMTRNLLLSATNYLEKPGFKANVLFERLSESYFGFNKEQSILCSIINKTQQLLDTKHISDSWIRRVFDYRGKLARAQVPYLIAICSLLLAVSVLLSILFIKNRKQGKQLSATVQKKTIELQQQTHLSHTDKLTNIYNRTKFDEELTAICESAKFFCVLLIDIDHFKNINDTYGHLAGDQVLVGLASSVSESIRSNDIFARWGGEEFILILQSPESLAIATELGKRLLKKIESKEFKPVGHITISIGATAYTPGDTPTQILQRADEALYQSKNNGRNTITAI